MQVTSQDNGITSNGVSTGLVSSLYADGDQPVAVAEETVVSEDKLDSYLSSILYLRHYRIVTLYFWIFVQFLSQHSGLIILFCCLILRMLEVLDVIEPLTTVKK